jgi:ABC-2 type transport system ATP-binding protein
MGVTRGRVDVLRPPRRDAVFTGIRRYSGGTTVTTAAIQVENLVKRYNDHTAVAGVSFDVAAGEIFGILGTNGAGKTTTVECLEGLRTPDSGTLRLLGLDPTRQADRAELRQRIGVQLQETTLPARLRVAEALELYASFYRRPAPWRTLLDTWDLRDRRRTAFADLSGGYRQRLLIALALVGSPEVVFLDELSSGLDPQARRATWAAVRQIRAGGTTVVLVTHYMDEAEQLCDRVAVFDRGRILALDTPAAVVERVGAGPGGLEAAFLALTDHR